MELLTLFQNSKNASKILKNLTTAQKNNALKIVSYALQQNASEILKANQIDVETQIKKGKPSSFIDRLTLTNDRISSICADIISVANLSDPVNKVISEWTTKDNLKIQKTSVPFGVIGAIYEARPNVTVDVFSLCLKTGNACLLKGGSDAENSNAKIVEIIRSSLKNTEVPEDAVILLPSSRSAAEELLKARGYVDLVVPRGSHRLIDYVVNNSLVPVIETGAGVCHTYVSKHADLEKAVNVVINAKTSRPSVCNAMETLLVDKEIAKTFIEMLTSSTDKIILRGGELEQQIHKMQNLLETGYYTEYGSYELSVKIIDGVKEAVLHINEHSTKHSDCICSKNADEIEYFLNNVDSACVYANASTRFSDGGCFGFGAELGISTQKLHARGPMGLQEMTTYQYKIYGNGEIR